jgi:hypothetical protein
MLALRILREELFGRSQLLSRYVRQVYGLPQMPPRWLILYKVKLVLGMLRQSTNSIAKLI